MLSGNVTGAESTGGCSQHPVTAGKSHRVVMKDESRDERGKYKERGAKKTKTKNRETPALNVFHLRGKCVLGKVRDGQKNGDGTGWLSAC